MILWLIYLIGNLIVLALVVSIMFGGLMLAVFAYKHYAPDIEASYMEELQEKLANSSYKSFWFDAYKLAREIGRDVLSEHTCAKFKFLVVLGVIISFPLILASAIMSFFYRIIYDYMTK